MGSREEMNGIYATCQREVELLQDNLSRFLLESAKCADYIVSYCKSDEETIRSGGDGEPLRALTAFKNYMSQMETITDMARKFNFHLDLNSKVFSDTAEEIFKPRFVKRFTDITNTKVKCCEDEDIQPQPIALKDDKKPVKCEATPTAETSRENKPQKRHVCLQVNTYQSQERYLQMDLSAFVAGYEFEAPITFIEQTPALIFYVQFFNQHIYNLSENMNFMKLEAPLASGDVFGLSMTNKFVLRAIVQVNGKAKLLDFGDVIPMNINYAYFNLPEKYQNIPAQALRCKLCGINEPNIYDKDNNFLNTILKLFEFKVHRFRVESKSSCLLAVRIIDVDLDAVIANSDPSIEMSSHNASPRRLPKASDQETMKSSMQGDDVINAFEEHFSEHDTNEHDNAEHRHMGVSSQQSTRRSKDNTYTLSHWLKDEMIGKCKQEKRNKGGVDESVKSTYHRTTNRNAKHSHNTAAVDSDATYCKDDKGTKCVKHKPNERNIATKHKSHRPNADNEVTKYDKGRKAPHYESDDKPKFKHDSKQKKETKCEESYPNYHRTGTIKDKSNNVQMENVDIIENFDHHHYKHVANTNKMADHDEDFATTTITCTYEASESNNQRTSTLKDKLYMQQLNDSNIGADNTADQTRSPYEDYRKSTKSKDMPYDEGRLKANLMCKHKHKLQSTAINNEEGPKLSKRNAAILEIKAKLKDIKNSHEKSKSYYRRAAKMRNLHRLGSGDSADEITQYNEHNEQSDDSESNIQKNKKIKEPSHATHVDLCCAADDRVDKQYTAAHARLNRKLKTNNPLISTNLDKRYVSCRENDDITSKYAQKSTQKNSCEASKSNQCATTRETVCMADDIAADDSKKQLHKITHEFEQLKRQSQMDADNFDLDTSIDEMVAKDEHKELLRSFKRECEMYKLKNKNCAIGADESNVPVRDKIGAFASDYVEYDSMRAKTATQTPESDNEKDTTSKKELHEQQTAKVAIMQNLQSRSEERDKEVAAIMKELSEMTLREDFLFTTDEVNKTAPDVSTATNNSCETAELSFTKAAYNPAAFLNTKEIHILSVTVTNVTDVNTFYVQVQHKSWRQPMIWNDNEISLSRKLVKPPQQNQLVMAQYICDQYWYRAEIKNIDPIRHQYEVFYVDFGSTDSVPLSCLAECNANQLRLPYLAIRCHFANIQSVIECDEVGREAIDLLNVILLNKSFRAELKHDGTEMAVKIIDSNFPDVPRVLLNMGFVKLIDNAN